MLANGFDASGIRNVIRNLADHWCRFAAATGIEPAPPKLTLLIKNT